MRELVKYLHIKVHTRTSQIISRTLTHNFPTTFDDHEQKLSIGPRHLKDKEEEASFIHTSEEPDKSSGEDESTSRRH
jgi:hypothetical protein